MTTLAGASDLTIMKNGFRAYALHENPKKYLRIRLGRKNGRIRGAAALLQADRVYARQAVVVAMADYLGVGCSRCRGNLAMDAWP